MTSTYVPKGSVSRRQALGSLSAMGLGFLAACSSSGPSKATSSSTTVSADRFASMPGPQRMREMAKHLEPTGYVKSYRVDASGKGGAHTSFKACYEAIAKDRSERLGTAAAAQSNIWDWRRVLVAPGTYAETAGGVPSHVALIGEGKAPSDVHVRTTGDVDAMATTGRSVYVRNIWFEQADDNPDSHALREQGQAGDVGLGPLQRRTIVFDGCVFTSGGAGAWGKSAVDIMPGPGTFMVFHGCTFDAPNQQQQVNVVTNAQPSRAPSNFAFIGCKVAGNHKRAGNSDASLAFPVGAPDFSEGRDEVFLWMDGAWALGDAVKVGALLAFPSALDATNGAVTQKRASTSYVVISPGEHQGAKAMAPDGTKAPTDAVPKGFMLPLEGVSEQERTFFGTMPTRAHAKIEPGEAADGTVTLTKGEVMWVALDLGGRAVRTKGLDLGSGARGQFVAAVTLDSKGKPLLDGNALTSGNGTGSAVTLESHWYYPGQGPVWVAVAATADTTVPAVKAKAGQAYGATGFTGDLSQASALTAVAAGTPVPRVTILSSWDQPAP